MTITNLILIATSIVSGVTSLPLIYLAVRSHRHQRRLHHAHLELHRLIALGSPTRRRDSAGERQGRVGSNR
jgi:hypothetical protein